MPHHLTVGFARKHAQLIVEQVTPARLNKLITTWTPLFVKDERPIPEGIYDSGDGLMLVENRVLGWEKFIQEVTDVEAFAWYAEHDHTDTLGGDETVRLQFLNRINKILKRIA